MLEGLARLIVDESKWLAMSLVAATLATAAHHLRTRRRLVTPRARVLSAMSLFFAATIGTMALGHLLAVTTKLIMGTLDGPILLFYGIGGALAAPSWLLVGQAARLLEPGGERGRRTIVLNAWLAGTLLALGLHNLPLAVPGLLNLGYHWHRRRVVGWAIMALACATNAGLVAGSLVFLSSGQTFEQLRGIE